MGLITYISVIPEFIMQHQLHCPHTVGCMPIYLLLSMYLFDYCVCDIDGDLDSIFLGHECSDLTDCQRFS